MLQQTIGTTNVAQKVNFLHALNISKGKQNSWIIDSGASDNVTGDLAIFDSYPPCQNNLIVQIDDGTLSKVMGKEASKPTPEPNENATENAKPTRGPEEITSENAEDIAVENAEDIAVETIAPTTETTPRNNVKLYSMKSKKGIESFTTPRQNQETYKTIGNGVLSGNTAPNSVNVNDIDIPIALRKNQP
ncbi:hypothetical protein KIW84_011017 [Lathyrus oleraceus]|uniref:Uncharacterized protein n=1 Tax=Pisum sativum TaxID=3888 RepID=A0A9D4YLI2_PEA|nr:hypothetical protein KIW84_011017 [Pisum sativum]